MIGQWTKKREKEIFPRYTNSLVSKIFDTGTQNITPKNINVDETTLMSIIGFHKFPE